MQFKRGYQEETFLKNMNVLPKDIEFLCDNCSKVCNSNQNNNYKVNLVITYLIFFQIYVWHTKTEKPIIEKKFNLPGKDLEETNLGELTNYLCLFYKNVQCKEDRSLLAQTIHGSK